MRPVGVPTTLLRSLVHLDVLTDPVHGLVGEIQLEGNFTYQAEPLAPEKIAGLFGLTEINLAPPGAIPGRIEKAGRGQG